MKLLEIALKEYGTKEIEGKRHNQTIVNYAKEAGFDWVNDDETAWCLDGRIEILTSTGFIKLCDVPDQKDLAVAMVTKSEKVKFTKNFTFIKKEHKGIAKEIKTNNLHIICDPTHEFYGVCDGSYIPKKKMIKNITKSGIGIPSISIKKKKSFISDHDLKLLAIFISDGFLSFKQLRVGVSKKRKKDILDTLDVKRKKDDSKKYGNRQLRTLYVYDIPELFNHIFEDYKILKWDFVMQLNKKQCKLFIDTYLQFDGNGNNEIYTQLKENQKILNYIATMAGYKSTPFKVKQVSENTKIDYLYHVYISKNKRRYILPHHVTDVTYNGYFYCVSVPTGKIVIRDLNGTIIQTGNCSIFMNWVCLQAGTIPTKKANARSWLDWGTPIMFPEMGDVVIFKRGNSDWQGHVALYINEEGDYLNVLGGNQSNQVKISKYSKKDILGFRRP